MNLPSVAVTSPNGLSVAHGCVLFHFGGLKSLYVGDK